MKKRSHKSSARLAARHFRGATLVEVVAALALLSTLVVMMLTARADHARQWSAANGRLKAVAAADALLTQWWQQGELPRSGEGICHSSESGAAGQGSMLRWRTVVIEDDTAKNLGCELVRLEIRGEASAPAPALDAPLAFVDVLLPLLPPATSAASSSDQR